MIRITGRGGAAIESLDEWRRFGGPKSDQLWREGYSAHELARHWLDRDGAAQLTERLQRAGVGREVRLEHGEAELVTRFDELRGEGRNHDLLVEGSADEVRLVVGVEAKAGEPLGPTFAEQVREVPSASRRPERLRALTLALLGSEPEPHPDLRYQLLTGLAGTLVEAERRGAARAALLVQQFEPPAGREGALERAAREVGDFVLALGGGLPTGDLSGDWSAGPFRVPGGGRIPAGLPVWVVHARA